MPRKSTRTSNFKSEAEEADWYATPAGRKHAEREFRKALQSGTLYVNPRGLNISRTDLKVLEELVARAKEKATQAISLRVPIADIEAAKALALKRGVGYQTILKQAIHDGLKRQRSA
jgi:hypothetical protein